MLSCLGKQEEFPSKYDVLSTYPICSAIPGLPETCNGERAGIFSDACRTMGSLAFSEQILPQAIAAAVIAALVNRTCDADT